MNDLRGYITDILASWGVTLTDLEFQTLLLTNSIQEETQYDWTASQVRIMAKTLLVDLIPQLLVRPDITEGGYSIKQNRDGILAYYNLLCAELGVANTIAPAKATLTDKSYLW